MIIRVNGRTPGFVAPGRVGLIRVGLVRVGLIRVGLVRVGLIRAGLFLAGSALAGCSSLLSPSFAPPTVTVTGAVSGDRTADAVEIDLALELENPGGEALPLREFRYVLWAAGQPVYYGRHAAGATLGPGRLQRVDVPAVLPASARVTGDIDWHVDGELTYLAPGVLSRVLIENGLWTPAASFTGEGRLR